MSPTATDPSHESDPAKCAPGGLELVQRFVNSVDLETGDDELATPAALVEWFSGRGLCDAADEAGEKELARALEVREGLRAVLAAHNGEKPDAGAIDALERAAAHSSLRASFAGERPRLAPVCTGVNAGLAGLMAAVTTAAADGSFERLKACADPGCRWAFFDRSKNRSGRWCSMATCGNQHKARAYRRRARSVS